MDEPEHNPSPAPDPIDDLLMTVGLRLRAARRKIDMTQKELAEKASLKQSYIFEIESGRTNITLRTLGKMATALDLDVRDLFPSRESGNSVSPAALALLNGVLERIAATLEDRERGRDARSAKEHTENMEFLAELRSFAHLRVSLEHAAALTRQPSASEPPTSKTDIAGDDLPGNAN